MKRTISLIVMLFVLTVLGIPDGAAQTPTPAQMEMFRQLPPAEQERLMREYGGQARRPQADEARARDRTDPRQTREAWENGEARETRRAEPVIDPATGLVLFGYGMFRGAPEAFAPVLDIPVPTDYMLGPGDVIQVQLLGRTPGAYTLTVNRDGAVNFPDLGPISVAGLTFDHARQVMQERVAQQMIGVSASITMGELRSIRVFVLGDVEHPGSYSVSSLSTMTHALLVSGGISPIGSLRNIQLRRNGDLVAALDLYDLVLRGDNSNDARLKAGDVIFVPPVGPRVGVDGEVRRPGMYELRGLATADELVNLAGGLSPMAFPRGATLERIDERRERIVEDLDLSASEGRSRVLRAGDLLQVPSVLERVDNAVELVGHVFRPARVQYRPGMRITDLVPSLRELKPLADAHYLLIRRELAPDRRVVALSADLAHALRTPGSEADVPLQPGDRVHVFSLAPVEKPELMRPRAADAGMGWLESDPAQLQNQQAGRVAGSAGSAGRAGDRPESIPPPESEEEKEAAEELRVALEADRQTVVEELLLELRLQATHDTSAPIVRVDGRVRAPGVYPLEPGMRVSDLLRAGGSLAESAYIASAEITRYEVVGGEYREAELIEVDLAGIRAGNRDADLALQSFDFLNIKEVTAWREQEAVTLRGEVRFPRHLPDSPRRDAGLGRGAGRRADGPRIPRRRRLHSHSPATARGPADS
jgi:polysaccharide biosynthesis/export protein